MRREAYVALLQAANHLRTQVASNHDYHGNDMAERLGFVREYALAADLSAINIALLVPEPVADRARALAAAAARLAERSENPSRPPDFTELESCVRAFTAEAVKSNLS